VSFFAVGSWQEVILVLAEHVAEVPEDLEDELAAQLFINPVAAMMLTRMVFEIAANPQAGILRISAVEDVVEDLAANNTNLGVVLLSVAGSTVARLAISILKAKGFTPIGLVRSTASVAAFQEASGITVIAHDSEGWQNRVRKAAAGRRIFAALDAVGGKIGEAVLGLLSPAGTLVSYGSLTGEPIPVDHVHLCMTAKKICGVGMVHWTQLPYRTRAADINTLIDMVREHRDVFRIAGEFPLSQVANAIRLFRTPGRDGTVLLSS
jgi:NADPH:quinone reductase-like Zn-dependent oxidoreductase